jgi:hypothetical protein
VVSDLGRQGGAQRESAKRIQGQPNSRERGDGSPNSPWGPGPRMALTSASVLLCWAQILLLAWESSAPYLAPLMLQRFILFSNMQFIWLLIAQTCHQSAAAVARID